MKGSLSATELSNTKSGLPVVPPKFPFNSKRPDPNEGPTLHNPAIIRKVLGKVVDQDYLDGKPIDGVAINVANYAKRRLIMKNRQKFPSDFFNTTKRNTCLSPNESFNKRQISNSGQPGFKVTNPECPKDTESSFQTLFGFSQSDNRPTHETPKFSTETISKTLCDEVLLSRNRALHNIQISKEQLNTVNAIDNLRRLDFSRLRTAFLPNSRTLGSLTERITSSNEFQDPRKANIYGRKPFEDGPHDSPFAEIYTDTERTLQQNSQDPLPRLNSPDPRNMYSYPEVNKKNVHTAPENKIRNLNINKMPTDLLLVKKRGMNENSKEIQSALPRIKNNIEGSEQINLLNKNKLNNLQNQNYFRPEDVIIKCFNLRSKNLETEERKGVLDLSPPTNIYTKKDESDIITKLRPYQIMGIANRQESPAICQITRDSSNFITHFEQEEQNKNERKHGSLDSKVEKFYGMSNLKCKENIKNDEGKRRKSHKRFSSIDIERPLGKEKESFAEIKMTRKEKQPRNGIQKKFIREHKKNFSMDLKKELMEAYRAYNDVKDRNKTVNKHKEEDKAKSFGLKRQMTLDAKSKESLKINTRDSSTTDKTEREKSIRKSQENKKEITGEDKNNNLKSENILEINQFETRMRGFTFDFDSGEKLEEKEKKRSIEATYFESLEEKS